MRAMVGHQITFRMSLYSLYFSFLSPSTGHGLGWTVSCSSARWIFFNLVKVLNCVLPHHRAGHSPALLT